MADTSAHTPRAAENIDPQWLTSVLRASGSISDATVVAIDRMSDIGTGQAARSVRMELTWDDPEGQPSSIVGKFPSADAGARATLHATGGYWREWLFYDQLAPTVDMRVPDCHVALFDPETSDFVLLMEDLRTCRPGDQIEGLSGDQLALAVTQAARLHGSRFGDSDLGALMTSGPGVSTFDQVAPLVHEMYAAVVPGFVERFADTASDGALRFVERAAPAVGRWFGGTGSPTTLVHQDYRPDNLLFLPDATDPLVVCDFQALTLGLGATDLAYLIGGGVADPDERAALERDLLNGYRDDLAAYDVTPSAEQLWTDYRHGSLWGVIMTVLSSMTAERTDRGDVMFTAMIDRHTRHADDLDALDLMD